MSAPPPAYKTCPHCQHPAPSVDVYCARCGQAFPSFFNPGSPPPSPHNPQPPYGPPGFGPQPFGPGYAPQPDSTKLILTLVLWFFLGQFGAHRLYLGHTETGLLMLGLFLAGLMTICLGVGILILIGTWVWWIADLVLILTRQLQPKDGSRIL